ncbi:hypothetical protein [Natronomonas sp. EA1]|uniref:hypothetical protein n=1 Tax=Natronomonas sp. EA1 TaxID=3421655 RepID=UPI003EBCDF8F
MTRRALLGIAVLVCGLLLAGVGAAVHLDAQQCRLVEFVSVTPAPENASTELPERAFSDLSTTEQSVFRSALSAGGDAEAAGVLTRRGNIEPALVTYEGTEYLVRVGRESGCGDPRGPLVVGPVLAGVALVGVGLGISKDGAAP